MDRLEVRVEDVVDEGGTEGEVMSPFRYVMPEAEDGLVVDDGLSEVAVRIEER